MQVIPSILLCKNYYRSDEERKLSCIFFFSQFMGISIENAKLCYSINFFKNPSNYYLIVTDGCISSLFLKLILNQLFVHLNSQFLYCGHSYFFREKKVIPFPDYFDFFICLRLVWNWLQLSIYIWPESSGCIK